ncbi:MAG: WD40 repeat domain-containing protein [Saccharofermentanaceae bacterium]|nr:WD40 repeat domain-containing protein [Saccharofermentanaceae bacterium]
MAKDRKISGWSWDMFISDDEKLIATSNSRNGIYVYDLETLKPVLKTKTVSYVGYVAVSPDRKLVAAKNTSGLLALLSMETGEEICRNKMAECEGYLMTFTDDSKYVLDLDHWGRTMLLNTENQFSILDEGFKDKDGHTLFSYLHYDRFSRNIYKIVDRGHGYKCAAAMVTPADKDHISYKVIREFQGAAPNHLMGISFCKEKNYYLTSDKKQIVATDKNFQEIERIPLPFKDEEAYRYIQKVLVSPGEKYAFISMGGTDSVLFELSSMKLVREFEYDSIADFKMIEDDRRYIISTWLGTYIGKI